MLILPLAGKSFSAKAARNPCFAGRDAGNGFRRAVSAVGGAQFSKALTVPRNQARALLAQDRGRHRSRNSDASAHPSIERANADFIQMTQQIGRIIIDAIRPGALEFIAPVAS